MPRQARGTAKTRIDLDHRMNEGSAPGEGAPTVEEAAKKLRPYLDDAIDCLGKDAATNPISAKAVLDFVKAADQEAQGSKGTAMLDRIAGIRGKTRGPAT